ncbi:hypothetical protein ABZP36_028969 [Zizania latifolia]
MGEKASAVEEEESADPHAFSVSSSPSRPLTLQAIARSQRAPSYELEPATAPLAAALSCCSTSPSLSLPPWPLKLSPFASSTSLSFSLSCGVEAWVWAVRGCELASGGGEGGRIRDHSG